MTSPSQFAYLALEGVQAGWTGERIEKFRGSLRDVFEVLVPPIVHARRPAASAETAAHLDEILAGRRRHETANDYGVLFVPDDAASATAS